MNPTPYRPSPAQSRRRAALWSFLRIAAVLILIFLLATTGYYLYVNVINRPPAEVYVVSRGTAISSVYGTVTITSNFALALFAQNNGYLQYAPNFKGITTIGMNGTKIAKDQLLATVVDEVGQRLLESAKRDYESAVSRQKNGPASAGLLQTAKARRDAINKLPPNTVAKVEKEAAESEVGRLEGAVNTENIDLQRLVDQTSNILKVSEDQLRRTEVRSPFDGILTAINFNDNAYVTVNQALFVINSAATYVSGEVNEEDVGELHSGMKADVRLYSYSNTTFEATLAAVLPNPVANSSRYVVTLGLDKPPDNLLFGMTGEMNIILGRTPNALLVPARAVNIDQVLIVEDGVVEQRTVKIVARGLEFMGISDGLSEGDQVIVSDQDAFKPGERVRPVKTNQGKAKK